MVTVPPELSVPTLKNSCDATLQSAYYGRNWSTVINLAKQRFKATKDPYYQVSRIYHLFNMHTPRIHTHTQTHACSLGAIGVPAERLAGIEWCGQPTVGGALDSVSSCY